MKPLLKRGKPYQHPPEACQALDQQGDLGLDYPLPIQAEAPSLIECGRPVEHHSKVTFEDNAPDHRIGFDVRLRKCCKFIRRSYKTGF